MATKQMPGCPLSAENVKVLVGNPAERILSESNEGDFDLIIMGTHGHGKLEDRIIGSIAADVIRQSEVPVMVVRLPQNSKLEFPANETTPEEEIAIQKQA